MLVPDHIAVLESVPLIADVISEPGAQTSTHEPKLLNPDLASEDVVEPTVIANGSEAGDALQAFPFSLPAATTIVTPALTASATAWLRNELNPPPNDMFPTHFSPVAQSPTT